MSWSAVKTDANVTIGCLTPTKVTVITTSIPSGGVTYTYNGPSQRHSAYSFNSADVESAVYSHIQAIRALGVTRVDSTQIAKALGLPKRIVDKVIPSLLDKGVRVINGQA
jgi:biotin operon repressor